MFQRAEGHAVLLLDTSIGRVKERIPAVSLSVALVLSYGARLSLDAHVADNDESANHH